MSEPFVILEKRIIHSSIWREDSDTRVVWITMLAMASLEDGTVKSSVGGLADVARVSIAKTKVALERFQQPDGDSSNEVNEGRRIEKISGGWRLLNHQEIKQAHQTQRKNEYMRTYMQTYRTPSTEGTIGGPLMDECQNWLADVVKNGADYTEKEMRGAWLALNAGGWMWGKNPITDWRSALERQIQTDRSKSYGSKTNRGSGGKRTNLTEGTRNEGNAHKYRNAAVKGVANVQGPATGNNAEGGAGVPGGTAPSG